MAEFVMSINWKTNWRKKSSLLEYYDPGFLYCFDGIPTLLAMEKYGIIKYFRSFIF